jgi:hypothetical protein
VRASAARCRRCRRPAAPQPVTSGGQALNHRWPCPCRTASIFSHLTGRIPTGQNNIFAARLGGPAQSTHQHLVKQGYGLCGRFCCSPRGQMWCQASTLAEESRRETVPLGRALPEGRWRGLAGAPLRGMGSWPSFGQRQSRLEWRDRAGQLLSNLGEAGYWREVALSHDGRLVAARRDDTQSNSDLWLHDVARNSSTRFTSDPSFDGLPVLSPDSSRIFFSSLKGGGGLYAKDAQCQRKTAAEASRAPVPGPSTDGSPLLYDRPERK